MGAQLKASRRKTREARDYPLRLPYLCRQRPLNTYESSGRVKRKAGHHVLWSVCKNRNLKWKREMNPHLEIHRQTLMHASLDLTNGVISMLRKQGKVRDTVPMKVRSRNSTMEPNMSNS